MGLSDKWDEFSRLVADGVEELAKNTVGDAISQAEDDADAFIEKTRKSLQMWAEALVQGAITKDDFEYLVGGQRDLATLHALKARGLAKTHLELFRDGLISLVIRSAIKAI